ncbi:MAG: sulfatase [Verrucomicrobiae bacterium]|nr:sulfatase [Verrucomicrobiae bacterium]
MMRFSLILFLLTLVKLTGIENRPNFLVIAIDDLNDYNGVLGGHPNASTPHLDRLAKQGVLFTNAHCNSPVCKPSRTAIWTGLRPTTTGITSNRAGWFRDQPGFENIVTLTQTVKKAGYHTFGYGKLYHTFRDDVVAVEWENFNQFEYGPWLSPKLNYRGRGDRITDWGVPPPGHRSSWDPEIADRTIIVLEDNHDAPFFLGCGFYRPHTPLYADQVWYDAHPIQNIQLPPGAVEGDTDDLVYFGVRERRPQDVEAPGLFDQDYAEASGKWKDLIQAYLASTTAMDYQLGRVMDTLNSSKYAKNTYIICFSDHGWHLGEKRHWGKAALWEQTTRVPFIIAGPGFPRGAVCDKPVELIDIYPTVMDYAELKPHHKLEGRSLRPLLEDVDAEWNYPAWTTFVDHHAVRTQDWRYIRYVSGEEELYDMKNDPQELENLAVTRPADSDVEKHLKAMRTELEKLVKTYHHD